MAKQQLFNPNTCKSITQFATTRREQYDFSLNQIKQVPFAWHIIVDAQVKCGKREIVIIDHKLDETSPGYWPIKHFYFTALLRKDAKVQIEELEAYGIRCFYSGQAALLCLAVQKELAAGFKVKVHIDESDYGSGRRQKMSTAFAVIKNLAGVQLIFYSASSEELIKSNFGKKCKILTFVPPKEYSGAEYYLANNLVTEADSFWDAKSKTFTAQGQYCLDLLKNGTKTIGVVRIASKMGEVRRAKVFENLIKKQYPSFRVKFVDAKESFDWGETDANDPTVELNDWEKTVYQSTRNPDLRLVIVICQTATRSTEIRFHQHIAFWHEGKRNTNYNTAIQAAGRVFFYDIPQNSPKNNLVKIELFANARVLELAAKRIDYDDYTGKLSGRMKVINEDGTRIEIKQQLVWFDHLPSVEECRAAAIKLGAYSLFTQPFNRNVSTTESQDNAKMTLSMNLNMIGNTAGNRKAMTMHFDGPSPNPLHAKTWKDVKFMGYEGKYAFIAEFLNTVAAGTDHFTNPSSMYES